MSETHDKFEAGCDFELDGPEPMADLPIEDRLGAWMAWSTYLKQRIRDHYRPRIAALEDELATAKRLNGQWMDEKTAAVMRAEKAEAEAKRWKSRRQATEQKLAYEEQLRGEYANEAEKWRLLADERWDMAKHEAEMRKQAERERDELLAERDRP